MSDFNRQLRREVTRLKEENQNLREEIVSLREYLHALTSLLDAIDELDPHAEVMSLLERILSKGMAVTAAKDGSLLVLDEESKELVFVLARGEVSPLRLIGHRIPPGKGIAGWVAEKGQPAIVNNARRDNRFYAGVDDAFKFQTNSVLAVPIIGEGRVLGVVEVLNKSNGKAFEAADQNLLVLLCRFAGDVLYKMLQEGEPETGAIASSQEAPTPPSTEPDPYQPT
jgi:GAF domain-containing protein